MTMPTPDSTRPPLWRRWAPPLALVVLLAFAGATIASAAMPTTDQAVAEVRAPHRGYTIPALEAPAPTVSAEPFVSPIEVVLPPPPPPPPAANSPQNGSSGGGSSGSSGAGGSGSVGTDYVAFCKAGGGAIAGASTAKGLLAAANTERSRFGSRALSWSSTLERSAQAWSTQMASAYDPANPGSAMTHGQVPSAGGQNVAAAWTSASSLSEAYAIGRAHSRWMVSMSHCINLLNPRWSAMGVATASAGQGKAWYTTANFQ